MNKRKKNEKSVCFIKRKPYTAKQEDDIFWGKLIAWIFIFSFPIIGLLALGMPGKIKVNLLLWGIFSLLFAFYNLLGLIFKWDHARVCAKNFLKRTYKFDVRNDWTKDDKKDIVFVVVMWSIAGIILLIGAIFH